MALPKKMSYLTGGTFNLSVPLLNDGDLSPFQLDQSGNLKVNIVAGGGSGSNSAAGPTGSLVPADADFAGVSIGGTLFGVTGFNLPDSVPMAVAIVNANGDQITSFGGGTQYATGTAVPTPTGTAALGWDGTDVRVLSTDSSGQLKVLVENTPSVTILNPEIQFADDAASGTAPTGTLSMGWDSTHSVVRALKVDTSQNLLVAFLTAQHVIANSGSVAAVTQTTSPWVTQDNADGIPGSAVPAVALQIAGSDGIDLRTILTDSNGQVKVLVENASPIAVSLSSTTITGTVSVIEGTNPWIVAGGKTPADSYANPTDAEDVFALLGGWDATNTKWQRVQVDAGTGTLKVDPGPISALISGSATDLTANNGSGTSVALDINIARLGGTSMTPTVGLPISDGNNDGPVAVKPASTAPLATDPALVVTLSPNSSGISISSGINITEVAGVNVTGQAAGSLPVSIVAGGSSGSSVQTDILGRTIISEESGLANWIKILVAEVRMMKNAVVALDNNLNPTDFAVQELDEIFLT